MGCSFDMVDNGTTRRVRIVLLCRATHITFLPARSSAIQNLNPIHDLVTHTAQARPFQDHGAPPSLEVRTNPHCPNLDPPPKTTCSTSPRTRVPGETDYASDC